MVRPSVRPAGRGGAKNYTRFALPVYVPRRAGEWPGIMYRSGRAPTTNATFPPALAVGGEGGGGATTAAGRAGRGRSTIRPPRAPRAHACRWAATCSASSSDEHLTRVRRGAARTPGRRATPAALPAPRPVFFADFAAARARSCSARRPFRPVAS